ncbi:MAG: homoserine kinase [Bacillus sp. (in: Bacteria)]|nr:homoserine kinase [Bacillus sp. (in: firmicutes)]
MNRGQGRGVAFTITVPGSTANLGPGFDSVGLAVDRYLTLHVERADQWRFIPLSAGLAGVPSGKENLVYEVVAAVAKEYGGGASLPPCEVRMESEIPMSRGLGSSASAIVAGVELANELLGLELSASEKVRFASLWEGHPDNVAASIYGGLVIGSHREDGTDLVFGGYPEVEMVAVVPRYELKTSASRGLLPDQIGLKDAVQASSVSNVLVASLLQGRWDIVGKMMSRDLFHQPYRVGVIPELKLAMEIVELVRGEGCGKAGVDEVSSATGDFAVNAHRDTLRGLPIYGVALSGAGPVVMFFAPTGEGQKVKEALESVGVYGEHDLEVLKVDRKGVSVNLIVTSAEA